MVVSWLMVRLLAMVVLLIRFLSLILCYRPVNRHTLQGMFRGVCLPRIFRLLLPANHPVAFLAVRRRVVRLGFLLHAEVFR